MSKLRVDQLENPQGDKTVTVSDLVDSVAKSNLLSTNNGAKNVTTSDGSSVQDFIDTHLSVLNLTELRKHVPTKAGQRISTYSAAATNYLEISYGAGDFISVPKGSLVDDGGYTIVPTTDVGFVWQRIVRGNAYVDDFGAKPDNSTDNAVAIQKALDWGHAKQVNLYMNAGIYCTSESPIIRSNSGLIGSGQEKTFLDKTTNNKIPLTVLPGFDEPVDCLVAILAKTWMRDPVYGDNFAVAIAFEAMSLRRKGVTDRSNAPKYGVFAPYLANAIVRDIRIECGYIGFYGENIYSNLFERVGILALGIGEFVGFQCSRYLTATAQYVLSGTSNVMDNVGVVNYQIGFNMDSMQYTTMNCCTADGIFPMTGTGETDAVAYSFHNPHGIVMNGCGSEGVKGTRVRINQNPGAVYDGVITINGFQGQIAPENSAVATPILYIANTYTGSTQNWGLNVTLTGCNFRRDTGAAPLIGVPFCSGTNADGLAPVQVRVIGSVMEQFQIAGPSAVDIKFL